MYTTNKDLSGFSLNDEYEEEEEIVERDEYYDAEDNNSYDDDEDEYYEDDEDEYEDYDEDYEEDEYDEEYDDDGDYNYPANYSDNDETLDKILRELAELKRNLPAQNVPAMAAPFYPAMPYVVSTMPMHAPQVVVAPSNEPAIYNELARIREELVKTQNAQNMHVEVARLKDNMRLDAKINESRMQDEIYRLNRQIENLQNRRQ